MLKPIYFILLALCGTVYAQTDAPQSVTIETQGSLQDHADQTPVSCQDLIEEIHRLRLNNEYLRNELNVSIAQIDKMKVQIEKLLQLQTQLYKKLEQQLQQTKPD